jgi:putative NADPH-quinone reductase
MTEHILIVDGHPDAAEGRYVHALADAYKRAAEESGHEVRILRLSENQFPLLRSNEDYLHGEPPNAVSAAQHAIAWSDHIAVFFPLWLGGMPALLKGFFEQVLRPGFAYASHGKKGFPAKLLKGKSARIVVTMGMPALFYRWYFRAHSLKSLERNIFGFVGIAPIRTSIVGSVEGMSPQKRAAWLERMRRLGRAGT